MSGLTNKWWFVIIAVIVALLFFTFPETDRDYSGPYPSKAFD